MEDKLFNAWMAGFWEGEGSAFKTKGHVGYCISISQGIDYNRDVKCCMDKIQNIFGGHITYHKHYNSNYRLQLQWRLTKRKDVIEFVNSILPYCQIRKKDLKNCLECFETHPRLDKRNVKIDIEKIKIMLENGKTYVQIAETISVLSPSAIWKRLHKYILVAKKA